MIAPVAKPKLAVKAYYSNLGVFFKAAGYGSIGKGVRIDGVKFEDMPKFGPSNDTILVQSDKVKVERHVHASKKFAHWKLSDESLTSDKIPLTLPENAIIRYSDDEDDEDGVAGTHKHLASLYGPVWLDSPERWEEVEFEITNLGHWQIHDLQTDRPRVTRVDSSYTPKAETVDLSFIVTYDELTQLVVPEFLRYNAPCVLPATAFYSIIRHHLMVSLDARYAELVSNNNEYLSVERILKVRPYSIRRETRTRSGNSYRPPRFTSQNADVKRETIYSVSCSARYSEKGLLHALRADSIKEMKEMIDTYLKELTDELNRPIQHCPHCEGIGLLEYKVKPIPFPVKN